MCYLWSDQLIVVDLCLLCLYSHRHVCYEYVYDFFFFNDTATTEIYTLSLHDAPSDLGMIFVERLTCWEAQFSITIYHHLSDGVPKVFPARSEEHTSELQSRETISYAVFCLKKKKDTHIQLKTKWHIHLTWPTTFTLHELASNPNKTTLYHSSPL